MRGLGSGGGGGGEGEGVVVDGVIWGLGERGLGWIGIGLCRWGVVGKYYMRFSDFAPGFEGRLNIPHPKIIPAHNAKKGGGSSRAIPDPRGQTTCPHTPNELTSFAVFSTGAMVFTQIFHLPDFRHARPPNPLSPSPLPLPPPPPAPSFLPLPPPPFPPLPTSSPFHQPPQKLPLLRQRARPPIPHRCPGPVDALLVMPVHDSVVGKNGLGGDVA